MMLKLKIKQVSRIFTYSCTRAFSNSRILCNKSDEELIKQLQEDMFIKVPLPPPEYVKRIDEYAKTITVDNAFTRLYKEYVEDMKAMVLKKPKKQEMEKRPRRGKRTAVKTQVEED